VGTVAAGEHRIVVRAVLADGRVLKAERRFTVRTGSRYVALGDSYSSGEGNDPYVDQHRDDLVFYEPTRGFLCHRSAKAWPLKLRPAASTDFQACSGARLVNFDTERLGKTYRGRSYDIALQNASLNPGVDLVTLTFGGNDIGFAEVLKHCATQIHCMRDGFIDVPGKELSLDVWTRIRIALIQNELDGLYRDIRSRVGPDASVVVASYPHLIKVGSRPACGENKVLWQDERQWLHDRIDEFDDVLPERAKRSGLLVADVRDRFDGHAVCDGDNWIMGLRTERDTDLDLSWKSMASFHPNDKGTSGYAEVVAAALRAEGVTTYREKPAATVSGPELSAVRAARRAERTVPTGPVRRAVSPALLSDGSSDGGVLAKYPAAVVRAVAATRIVPLVLGDAAAMRSMPSCGAEVVRGEQVPFAASGFTAGSQVTLRLTGESLRDRTVGTLTADDNGRAAGWARMPADLPIGAISGLSVRGHNPQHGQTLGFAVLRGTAAAGCVAKAHAAGLLGPIPPAAPVPNPGRLAHTGSPEWLLPSVCSGLALILVGCAMVLATRNRSSARRRR
jgi:lysophospholipase L1-like esterase